MAKAYTIKQGKRRQTYIVNVFNKCFGDKMKADPAAWQTKFRKMSALLLLGRKRQFEENLVHFGLTYGAQVRSDYNLFVDAFRNDRFSHL